MKPDKTPTQSVNPTPPTDTFDAGLAAAFGDPTPGGWSQPPLLRDDPSEHSPLVQPSSTEMPRGTSDRYQLLGEIARGGMGVILKGRDPDLGRDLAFKVLKAELAGKATAVQRFTEEAQVGGQLQHPGVVPVYDIGRFADGRPYFAMKLVKGRTLAEMLAEREDPAAERGKFLQVFLQICQTIAYAHAKGVIHRDLKPSNVMVGAFGEVLVMDWGLAKVLPRGGIADELKAQASGRREPAGPEEPTVIHTARAGSGGSDTQAGSVMGTPAFMPPEQAGGEIDKLDERADVFGLGAVLCVILTGQPPYLGPTAEAIRLMAVRGQLADAFARLDTCGADAELVTLCKRCLSPERDARPRHAGEVADAVGAYLAGVEQRAHQTELDRAAAEARTAEEVNTRREAEAKAVAERKRRRVQLALAASVGLLLLGGGAFGWWQDKQATARRTEAANRDRDERERVTRNADALAASLGRCEDALRAGDAEVAGPALAEVEKRLPEGGGDELLPRIERCRADLAMLRELDRIDNFRWTSMGSQFPDHAAVADRWRAAFAGFGIAPRTTPPTEAVWRVNDSLIRERLLEALDLWLASAVPAHLITILAAADPDPYRDAVRASVLARDAARVRELTAQPAALEQPARFAVFLGLLDPVPEQRKRTILETAVLTRPGSLSLLMQLAATDLDGQQKVGEVLRWYQAAVAAHPRNAAARHNLGLELKAKGDKEGAIACFREAIRLEPNARSYAELGFAFVLSDVEKALTACQEAVRLDPKLGYAHQTLGIALLAKGDAAGAGAAFQEWIALPDFVTREYKKKLDLAVLCLREVIRLDPSSAAAHRNLGNVLSQKRELDEAIAELKKAIGLDPKSAPSHTMLGRALILKRDWDGAIPALREAIQLDPNHPASHGLLGEALWEKGELDSAIAAYRECVRLGPKFAEIHSNLGSTLRAKGELDAAITSFREAIRLDPKLAIPRNNLASALLAKPNRTKADLDEAIAELREAIWLDPKVARPHFHLGNALREKGDPDGAIAAFREATRLDPDDPEPHCRLGLLLQAQGHLAEALPLLYRGHELGSKTPGWRYPSDQWVANCERQLAAQEAKTAPLPREVKR